MAFTLVTLALNTGMRQGELLKLKWENVDVERGSITIIQGKTLRRKTIAINEPARNALAWLREFRKTLPPAEIRSMLESSRAELEDRPQLWPKS